MVALCVQGRFTIAAKHHITIAEIYETELVDIDKVRLNQSEFLLPVELVISLFEVIISC